MSKIVARILEHVGWLDDLSVILTIFFIVLFIILVISVLRMKREKVEEYKRLPLDDDGSDANEINEK